MKRILTVTTLIFALGTVLSGAALRAAPDSSEQKLQRALQILNELQPSLDAATKQHVPALRAILTRKFRSPETITVSEDDLVSVLLKGTDLEDPPSELVSRDPQQKLKELKMFLASKAPGIAKKPTFRTGERATPGGKKIGYVEVNIDGRRRTVVEILAASPGLTLAKRARTVGEGMRALHSRDPLWWTHMTVGRLRGQYVVEAPNAPRGYIITADSAFAKEWGLGRAALAAQLIRTIRSTFDPNTVIALRSDSPDAMRDRAVELRTQGDAAFSSDTALAEQSYKEAVESDPGYVTAYSRLAALYRSQRRSAEARELLKTALKEPNLSAEQKQELQQELGRSR